MRGQLYIALTSLLSRWERTLSATPAAPFGSIEWRRHVRYGAPAMRYAINEKLVTFRVLDDGAVLVNHETGHYYTLNTTGTFLWELLTQREMTAAELTASVAQEFEQPESAVAVDVQHCLDDLTREHLLVTRR